MLALGEQRFCLAIGDPVERERMNQQPSFVCFSLSGGALGSRRSRFREFACRRLHFSAPER